MSDGWRKCDPTKFCDLPKITLTTQWQNLPWNLGYLSMTQLFVWCPFCGLSCLPFRSLTLWRQGLCTDQYNRSYCLAMVVGVVSLVSPVQLFATPWTVALQAPLSLGFSRQEYWSGLPFPPPGDPSDPGIEPASLKSPASAGRFFITNATWEALRLSRHLSYLRLSFKKIYDSVGTVRNLRNQLVRCSCLTNKKRNI